jgi:hypothetical protein
MPSFGGEVKESVPCPSFWQVKEPSTSVNYYVLEKFLVKFPRSLAEVSRAHVVRGASGDE